VFKATEATIKHKTGKEAAEEIQKQYPLTARPVSADDSKKVESQGEQPGQKGDESKHPSPGA
jgi:hypothetical protein